jgi:GDP-L-fucose synthase
MINKYSRVLVLGHKGLVGSSIFNLLKNKKYKMVSTIGRKELDLRDQTKTTNYLLKNKFDAVILCAAKVGGIGANINFPAEFIYDNLMIQSNVIHGSYLSGVKNLIFFGSSAIYPPLSLQPFKEKYLLSNYLEKTNNAYSIAKIAGIKMCESYNNNYKTNYKCLVLANVYGANDNSQQIENKSFFSSILLKIFNARNKFEKEVILWGTGKPKRELIHVEDVARASLFFLKKKTKETYINIGTGLDYTIKDYANLIKNYLNVNLKIKFDGNKMLDGPKRKLLNVSLMKKYNFTPLINIKAGFKKILKEKIFSMPYI